MAYAYSITHISTGIHYYGVRFKSTAKPEDLGKTYFSSSKGLKRLILLEGTDNFTFKVRRIFDTREKAVRWEHLFLSRVNAKNSAKFFNLTNGSISGPPDLTGIKKTELTKQRMRKPKSPEHRAKLKIHLNKNRVMPKWTDEKRMAHSEKMKGNQFNVGKIGWSKGKTAQTDERLLKLSQKLKGKKQIHGKRLLKVIECPHCHKLGKGGNMTRYHFDKCKFIT